MEAIVRIFSFKRVFQGRLIKGDEIISGITEFIKKNSIKAGIITGIGAVGKATVGYYDQTNRKYLYTKYEEPMEILSLKGNISMKDHEPFPHIHAVFSKSDFSCFGGHLFEAEVFAFEFEIIEFEGNNFFREYDNETGLFLWSK